MKFPASKAAVAATLLTTSTALHTIDPNSVDLTIRESWCRHQTEQCPFLCAQYNAGQDFLTDTCDPTTLTYTCTCKNGITPNASEFSLTLDYFICQAWSEQCKDACNGDNACIANCGEEIQCGAQTPRTANKSLITTTSSSTAVAVSTSATSATATLYSGLASEEEEDATTTATGAAASVRLSVVALSVGQTFGIAGLVGAFFAGFALLL